MARYGSNQVSWRFCLWPILSLGECVYSLRMGPSSKRYFYHAFGLLRRVTGAVTTSTKSLHRFIDAIQLSALFVQLNSDPLGFAASELVSNFPVTDTHYLDAAIVDQEMHA